MYSDCFKKGEIDELKRKCDDLDYEVRETQRDLEQLECRLIALITANANELAD
jgi:FtsZ-binding cell division protein ZapB